jgi:hypothetical protein
MARGRWVDASLKRYPKRFATADTAQEGDWLCHEPSGTWFEFYVLTPQGIAVGFGFGGKSFFAPLRECYHAWDPDIDAPKKRDV